MSTDKKIISLKPKVVSGEFDDDWDTPIKLNPLSLNISKLGSTNQKKSLMLKPNMETQSSVESIYQKLEHRAHILHEPGMYVGSVRSTEQEMFIHDNETKQIIKKKVKFVPGLYKIYDEGVVNMADHHVRMRDIINNQKAIIEGKLPPSPKIDTNRKYKPVKTISINVDIQTNIITFRNDGEGIDVAWLNSEKMYVPELIFGNLLSGTSFDKDEQKTVGGKHGYGAKLINVLSDEFIIETGDAYRGIKYTQRFSENMSIREDPIIDTSYKGPPYTQLIFKPDFARFGLTSLSDDDTALLMEKRAYDIAACTSKDVNVWYNGNKLDVKTFERYVDLYIGARGQCKRMYSQVNQDWEIAVCASSDGNFEQTSFVNGICTYRGGKHVDHVATIISNRLSKYAIENKKGMSNITPKSIKDNLWIFVNSTIVNPEFESQTKDNLTTNVSEFRSRCDISDDFIIKLSQPKIGILEKALKLSEFKAGKGLKKSDGKKTKRVKNDKAIHAHYAGDGKKAQKCTLILTEGDSAQTLAVSGLAALSEEERKFFGVLPLKGKIVNPKDCKISSIEENAQFLDIKQLLGLKQGVDYSKSISGLRYGRVMIITDADVDGDHIKGLVFNMFHEFWPALLKLKGFFVSLLTYIVKVTKKGTKINHCFYSLLEYQNWKQLNEKNLKQWNIKYYKGLGTHEASEAREIFKEMKVQVYSWDDLSRMIAKSKDSEKLSAELHESPLLLTPNKTAETAEKNEIDEIDEIDKIDDINSKYIDINLLNNIDLYKKYYKTPNKHPCDLSMDLAFRKKNANYRKGWISEYLRIRALGQTDPNLHNLKTMSFYDFINEKLIEFSVYDNERNISNIMDGLKPGQRKILYGVFKRKLRKEIRVAQLTGYISEHTAYHHGEESLNGTIISLAQDYTGSNNINLLIPNGQFGTRFQNGADHASPRYIHTYMNPLTEAIFNNLDENLYEYLDDDGVLIEPKYYVPVTAMVLINGTRGIGTGWSSDVPNFNPADVNENIKRYLVGEPFKEMIPWWRGFNGTVVKIAHQKYKVTGVYRRCGPCTIEITEIPVGSARESKSFKDYKNIIESMIIDDSVTDPKEIAKQILQDAEIFVSDTNIKCLLHFPNQTKLDELMSNLDTFEKILKLSNVVYTSNMNLFNVDGIMTKYQTAEEILAEYCKNRLYLYDDRKKYIISELDSEILKISEKIRFISYINDESHPFKVQKRLKKKIIEQLSEYHFAKFEDKKKKKKANQTAVDDDNNDNNNNDNDDNDNDNDEADNDNIDDEKGSYDYLLKMPIYSLTAEKIDKLMKEKDNLMKQLSQLKETTVEQLWGADLDKMKMQLLKHESTWNTKYEDILKLPKGIPRIPDHLKTKVALKPKIITLNTPTSTMANKIILKKK